MYTCNIQLSHHADGAKRDTIGHGQAIQRQALSGILGKILSRKDAVAMRCITARAAASALHCTCLHEHVYLQQQLRYSPFSHVHKKCGSQHEACHAVCICRAPAIPVPPAKQDKQFKVSPKALAARLHEQAGKLAEKASAPDDDDILVLSGDESDPEAPNEDAVLADESHSLVGLLNMPA